MVSPYLPEGVKHHDFSHQNAVLPSSKWEQSSQTYFAAHRVALPRQHPAAAQRAGGAPAAAHESCSVVPWVAMASSRPPAPAAAAAAAPRLRARRLRVCQRAPCSVGWRRPASSLHRAAARRTFPNTRCLPCAVATSLGRCAAPGKHVVIAAPQSAVQAEVQCKEAALLAKDAVLQSKDAVIEVKDALIRRLQSKLQRRDDAPAAAGGPAAPAPAPATAPAPSPSLGRYAAPGQHVVSAAPQPAAPTSALKRLAPDTPSLPPLLQRHKDFIYVSAHVRYVDVQPLIGQAHDGDTPVGIDAGFEVAPGDASDVEVANAHAWGSHCLTFSSGSAAASALLIAQYPSLKGIASYFSK